MFYKDYIVVDNILDNPNKLIDLAKSTEYYYNTKFPGNLKNIKIKEYIVDNNNVYNWAGFRSTSLHSLDKILFQQIFEKVFTVLFKDLSSIMYRYDISAYLHYNCGTLKDYDNWWHTDTTAIFAGIIYLSPNPEKDSGTIIKTTNKLDIVVDNVFNRLVFYNANLFHRPQRLFGTTTDNARLTLVFFVNRLDIWKAQ